MVSYDELLWMN